MKRTFVLITIAVIILVLYIISIPYIIYSDFPLWLKVLLLK